MTCIDPVMLAQRIALLAGFCGFLGAALWVLTVNAVAVAGNALVAVLARRKRIRAARARAAQFAQAMPRG